MICFRATDFAKRVSGLAFDAVAAAKMTACAA